MTCYFDPLSEWPVKGTLTLAGSRKSIGEVTCISPFGESRDQAAEMVKAIRQSMMTETRILSSMHTTRQIRTPGGILATSTSPERQDAPRIVERTERPPISFDRDVLATDPRASREIPAAAPRVTRDDLSRSLSRRAELARQLSFQP